MPTFVVNLDGLFYETEANSPEIAKYNIFVRLALGKLGKRPFDDGLPSTKKQIKDFDAKLAKLIQKNKVEYSDTAVVYEKNSMKIGIISGNSNDSVAAVTSLIKSLNYYNSGFGLMKIFITNQNTEDLIRVQHWAQGKRIPVHILNTVEKDNIHWKMELKKMYDVCDFIYVSLFGKYEKNCEEIDFISGFNQNKGGKKIRWYKE